MRNLKLVIGILSIIFCVFIMFQSCAARVVTSLDGNHTDTSGSRGVLVSITMLVAGINAIVTRDKKTGTIVTGLIFAAGGLLGLYVHGIYKDLIIWSVLELIFATVFIISGIQMKKQ